MTITQRVNEIVHTTTDLDQDRLEKLVYLAYYMGREDATRAVSNRYNALIQQQRQRASECRYSHMANAIIGDQDYIYTGDYAQDMTATFGGDATTI